MNSLTRQKTVKRRRTVSKQKKRKPVRSLILYVVIIAMLSVVALSYKTLDAYLQRSLTTFKLEDIEVQGNAILSKQDVLDLCGLEQGAELLEVKPVDVVKHLTVSPYIKSVSVVRSLPSRLRIVIDERQPVAFIHGRGLNLIDSDGVLIPVPKINHRWDLPYISGIQHSLGELGKITTSDNARKAVEVLNYLEFMESPVKDFIAELRIDPPNLLQFRLMQGGAKVFVNIDSYQENLFVLSEYLDKYLNYDSAGKIEYLDLRYEDQLIIKERTG